MSMENQKDSTEDNLAEEGIARREALIKAGKFGVYAAPFTVLALTNKAEAASGTFPGRH